MSTRMTKADLLFAALAFLLPLLLYGYTLCPTVPVGDGGELICAAGGLGIAHPTGYPLFCLLGRLFGIILPVGNMAARINAMSSFFSALAALMVYFLVRELLREAFQTDGPFRQLVALIAALGFAFSETMWSQAVQAEVYALQAFLVAAILVVMVLWRRTADGRMACLLGLLWGMSFANHTSAICLLGAMLYLCISFRARLRLIGYVPELILFFLIGISLYLYLPLRSALNPPHDWGNPESLHLLWDHVTARAYRRHFLFAFPLDVLNNIRHYISLLCRQFGTMALILSLMGAVLQGIRRRGLFALFLLVVLGNVLLAASYDIQDIAPYYMPSFLIFALWMGLAASAVLGWLSSRPAAAVLRPIAIALFLLLVALSSTANFAKASQRGMTLARDYGQSILSSVEPEAILFVSSDNESFPATYLHEMEGVRPDVALFDMGSKVEAMRRFVARGASLAHIDPGQIRRLIVERTNRPINFAKEHMSAGTDPLQMEDLPLIPFGMVYRLRGEPGQIQEEQLPWSKLSEQMLENFTQYRDYRARRMMANFALSWGEDLLVRKDTSAALNRFALAQEAIEDIGIAKIHNEMGVFFRRLGWVEGAKVEFERASMCPQKTRADRSSIHVNLGNLYMDLDRADLAREEMEKALAIWPGHDQARFNLARLMAGEHLKDGHFDQAASEYEKMLALDDDNAPIWFNLGMLYAHRLEHPQRAMRCFRQYLALQPSGAAAERAREELGLLEGRK
jgi:hypothetical protein